MKFMANENIPMDVVNKLREAGYEFIRSDGVRKGLSDKEIIQIAQKENRILVTFDKDFGEFVFKKKFQVEGIILLRIKPQSSVYIFDRIQKLFNSEIDIKGKFIVLEKDKVRVRELI